MTPEGKRRSREERDVGAFSPNYVAFFEAFNSGHFFEAHEVLEVLWLKERANPDGNFFKGLIQVAGAFVHVRKSRRGPAIALLNLAQDHLVRYPSIHNGLNVKDLLVALAACQRKLESASDGHFSDMSAPKLVLRIDGQHADRVKRPGCFDFKDVQ